MPDAATPRIKGNATSFGGLKVAQEMISKEGM
jgi:hypothetical protein